MHPISLFFRLELSLTSRFFRLTLIGVLSLVTFSGVSGEYQLRGTFAGGGRTYLPGTTQTSFFGSGFPALTSHRSGPVSILSYTLSPALMVTNPSSLFGVSGLERGEAFFYGVNPDQPGSEVADLYGRLPRVIKAEGAIVFSYFRSRNAAFLLDWEYEVSTDLIEWNPPAELLSEAVLPSGALEFVKLQFPSDRPAFVRIRFNY